MIRIRIRTLFITILLALGLWQFGEGSYIYAKAAVAQELIEEAWHKTLQNLESHKPWPWADTWPVARIKVPELDVDLYVLAGDNGRALAFGPGYRFGTALPGELGTSLISGHRDTHFKFLKDLHNGTEILLQDINGQWHRYVVEAQAIVDASQAILEVPDMANLVLVTCYPFEALLPGGPLRYVVRAFKQDAEVVLI